MMARTANPTDEVKFLQLGHVRCPISGAGRKEEGCSDSANLGGRFGHNDTVLQLIFVCGGVS